MTAAATTAAARWVVAVGRSYGPRKDGSGVLRGRGVSITVGKLRDSPGRTPVEGSPADLDSARRTWRSAAGVSEPRGRQQDDDQGYAVSRAWRYFSTSRSVTRDAFRTCPSNPAPISSSDLTVRPLYF